MPKKEPKQKKKIKSGLTQKERFIEYAREIEVDESGETFDKKFKNIAVSKKESKI